MPIVNYFFELPNEFIALLIIGSIISVISSLIVKHLSIISRGYKLNAYEKFNAYLAESVNERKFLYSFTKEPPNISQEEEKKLQYVINTLNNICVLLEYKMVSPKLAFGVCHTMIVRCEYKLGFYMDYQELKIGGRYGRRVRILAKRAKKYHDVHRMHRIHPIKVTQGNQSIVIYETNRNEGFAGLIQNIGWLIRYKFKIY